MKKQLGFLCTLLGLVLAGISGCSTASPAPADPEPTSPTLAPELMEYLQISDPLAEDLRDGIQTIEKTSEKETSTVQVMQALGNTRELYVLYTVTVPEETLSAAADQSALFSVTLSGTTGSVIPLPTGGRYLSYFEGPAQGWDGEELLFMLTSDLFQDTHELSWTSTVQGEILDGSVTTEAGETVGTVSLSPYSLRFSMNGSEETDTIAFLDTIALVDQDDNAIPLKGGRGVSSGAEPAGQTFSGSIDFQQVLDLSTVTAIQIDGHTVPLK